MELCKAVCCPINSSMILSNSVLLWQGYTTPKSAHILFPLVKLLGVLVPALVSLRMFLREEGKSQMWRFHPSGLETV